MNNPKISIIVPVYNAEKFLHRCIDSILEQTFTDFEVLLVNDGSKDRSGIICDEYATKDSRVRVFHKENGGVSSARNVGIKNMQGEYSIHVDSDDWIEPNMYEKMYDKAIRDNADMVICDYRVVKSNTAINVVQKPENLSPKHIISEILETKIHGSVCNKLLRKELIDNITFNERVTCCEDLLFLVEYLLSCKSAVYLNETLYNYFHEENSLTNNLPLSSLLGLIFYIDCLEELVKDDSFLINSFYIQIVYIKVTLIKSFVFTPSFIRQYKSKANYCLKNIRLPLITKICLKLFFIRLGFWGNLAFKINRLVKN